jgi:large subunit ribosomal protein L21
MYAIAKCGGKQFRLEPQAVVRVPALSAPIGEKVRLEEILFLSDGSKVEIGRPLVEGAYAEAVVVRHGRHRKLRIIKYKRRKGYRRTIGHRQEFTELEISEIVLGGKKKAAAPDKKKEAAPVEGTGLPAVEAQEAVAAAKTREAGKTAQAGQELKTEPQKKRAAKAEAAPKKEKEAAEKVKAEVKPKRTAKAPAKAKAAAEKPAAKPAAKAATKKKAAGKSESAGKKPASAGKKKAEEPEQKG